MESMAEDFWSSHNAAQRAAKSKSAKIPGMWPRPSYSRIFTKNPLARSLGGWGQGLDTRVGEGSVRVSGGERQRLSIARALLRRPRLFIFDEATSSLDSITEREVTASVREVSGSRQHMVILIAHRLSTIAPPTPSASWSADV